MKITPYTTIKMGIDNLGMHGDMRPLSLKKRIFLPLITAGLVVFSTGGYFVGHLENRQKHDAVEQQAASLRSHLQSALATKAEVMAATLRFIAQDQRIVKALQIGDRPALQALTTPLYQRLRQEHGITHFYFHDARRVNLLRVHKPEKHGDAIDRFTALGAEKTGALSSGIELGPLGTFTLRSVLPIFANGQLLGYIELGQEIDGLIQETQRMFHVELFMLIDKRYLDRGEWESGMRMLGRAFAWDGLASAVLVSQSLQDVPVAWLDAVADSPADTSIRIRQDILLHGRHYWAGIIPVQDAGGRRVATLAMLRDMTDLVERAAEDGLIFAGVSVSMALGVLVLFNLILGRTERELAAARQKLVDEGEARAAMQSRFIRQLQDEQAKLHESEEKFEKISASAQDAIISMDNAGNISFWNVAAETIFGYTSVEALGKSLHELIAPSRFHAPFLKAFPAFQQTGQGAAVGKTLELAAIRKDGTEFPVELALSSTQIAGQWNGIAVLRDITERKRAQQEIERALHIQRVLDMILNISLPPMTLTEVLLKSLDAVLSIPAFSLLDKGAIFLTSEGGQTLDMVAQRNLPDALLQACARLPIGRCLCGKAAATREMVFYDHLNEQHEIRYEGIEPHGHYCLPIMADERLYGILNIYVPDGHVSDESERMYLKTVANTLATVIERKQAEEKLRQLAHHDPLTGLPNRALFYDRLERVLALAQRHREEFALLFLDLDHFKEINDTLGHDMGDALLKETAFRLLASVRNSDTVARMGGDEFTVIITKTTIPESVEQVVKRIQDAFAQPFELQGKPHKIGCSIGTARYPAQGEDTETLLKHADAAMYHAKRQGRGME